MLATEPLNVVETISTSFGITILAHIGVMIFNTIYFRRRFQGFDIQNHDCAGALLQLLTLLQSSTRITIQFSS